MGVVQPTGSNGISRVHNNDYSEWELEEVIKNTQRSYWSSLLVSAELSKLKDSKAGPGVNTCRKSA